MECNGILTVAEVNGNGMVATVEANVEATSRRRRSVWHLLFNALHTNIQMPVRIYRVVVAER